jgi:replicative DNA helicase
MDANLVFFLHRSHEPREDNSPSSAKLIVAKNRYGPLRDIELL